jgi:hypothetical protein
MDSGTGVTGTGRGGLNINLKYRRCAYVRVHASRRSNQYFTTRIVIHIVVMMKTTMKKMMMMIIIIIITKKKQKTFSPINSHSIFSELNYTVHPEFSTLTQISQLLRLLKSETVI